MYYYIYLSVFLQLVTRTVFGEGCSGTRPLGLSTGEITDEQITASSAYPSSWDSGCEIRFARLYMPDKRAWCAKTKSKSEWLQIDLGVRATVRGSMIQGRGDGKEWVKSYRLSFSDDSLVWTYITDVSGEQRILPGNSDGYSPRYVVFEKAIKARYVRIHPRTWNNHPSMRAELYGCYECREPLGQPPFGEIEVSSELRRAKSGECQAYDGNIYSSKSWCTNGHRNQWIQLDIGPPSLVTGLVTKGRGDTKRRNWVTTFNVAYRNSSSSDWMWYMDPGDSVAKAFVGNMDKQTAKSHYLVQPFVARFIRFYPLTWHNHIAMRVGAVGCPHRGTCDKEFMSIGTDPDMPCVENIAYKAEAWLSTRSQRKRHLGMRRPENKKQIALRNKMARVMGSAAANAKQKCLTVDNKNMQDPGLVVDLGKIRPVTGIILKLAEDKKSVNLEKLSVYVAHKASLAYIRAKPSEFLCATRIQDPILNFAGYTPELAHSGAAPLLRKPKGRVHDVHFECGNAGDGRYVVINVAGTPHRNQTYFGASICQVVVY